MTSIAIELADDGLRAIGDDGLSWGPSPGYVLLDDQRLVVGAEARARARLRPRWIDNRFWDRLDRQAMPRPFPRDLSHLDVVHLHLSEFWREIADRCADGAEPTAVRLVVPGCFSVAQLGMILGVAHACSIPVTGMFDAAIAAASRVPVSQRTLHLDLLLHRAVWTELEHDGELARRRVEVLEESGLVAFQNLWARHIAAIIVRQTRFDPLHQGRAEQSLYDDLPGWMTELALGAQVRVSVSSGDKQHEIELAGQLSEAVSGPLLDPVVELGRSLAAERELPRLLLSARAATIPGLVNAISRLPHEGVEILPAAAAVAGAWAQGGRDESPGSALRLITRLPAELGRRQPGAPVLIAGSRPSRTGGDRPATHVLFAGRAYPLGDEVLWLGTDPPEQARGLTVADSMPGLSRRHCVVYLDGGDAIVEDHSTYGTFLNDRRIEGRASLSAGDRLRLGTPGVELLLIEVDKGV